MYKSGIKLDTPGAFGAGGDLSRYFGASTSSIIPKSNLAVLHESVGVRPS